LSAIPVADVSRRQQSGFYAPTVEVRVEGAGLPSNVVRDVSRVVYRDCVERIDSFEVTVHNWDDATNAFKYIGSETAGNVTGGGELASRHQLFEPSNKLVELHMGYVGSLTLMMTGTFTTLEPNFSSTGPRVLLVRCLNALHLLRRKPYTTTWRDTKDSDIAEQLANLRDGGTKRFPLPVRTDPEAKSQEEAVPFVLQDNQYDIDFLLTRARRLGYVIVVEETQGTRELYFGPSHTQGSEVAYELEWGKSITHFMPTLTTANQVRSVTVHGWNRDTQEPIAETVDITDSRIAINRDLHRIIDADPREEHIVHEPVFTPREARERAVNLLLQRSKQMVHASVTTIGLPEIRAGRRVEIIGVGARLSGTYFITDSVHTYCAASGYTTRFEARREDRGGTA
jgi:phage protein D